MIVPIQISDEEYMAQSIQGKPLVARLFLVYVWIQAIFFHLGQTRRIGGRTVEHGMVVSKLAREFGLSLVSEAAGLLHDAIEDAVTAFEKVLRTILMIVLNGPIIAIMVFAVTKWSKDVHQYFCQIIWWTAIYWPIIVVKMLDRLHNVTCPYGGQTEEERIKLLEREKRMLRETVGPFRAMCRICRRYIPTIWLAQYDKLLAKVIYLAMERLAAVEKGEN